MEHCILNKNHYLYILLLHTIKKHFTDYIIRIGSNVAAGFIARAVEESPSPCFAKFSPLSDRPVCSTSGNRRNEKHYSGGWKTPLITSRRAVRYPLDLPPGWWCAVRPNCLLTSWAKIGAITLRLGRCFSSCTSFVVSHSRGTGMRKKKDQVGEEDTDNNTKEKEKG